MEIIVAVIGPVVECTSPHIAKRWQQHRDIKKNMGSLNESSERLNRRKSDLKSKLEIEVIPGETEEVEELKFWQGRVETMISEVEKVENEVRRVKFISRARLGRRIEEMIPDVENLYKEGAEFQEGKLVRMLARRGHEKPTTTAIFGGETTAEKTKVEILNSLANKKAMRIGVHGMGGLGKTTVLEHLHNDLLRPGDKIGNKFDKVIWITASKASGVRGLQDKIGREFDLGLGDKDDEEIRAKVLLREFSLPKNKRFLLIIDDLWEDYPLEKVGVPNLTLENGCKLIVTTRSRDVCSKMKCDAIIGMRLQSEQEAVELFFDKVGKSVASDPNLSDMARRVARECAGLPLAIVTMAGSLRDKTDVREWEVVLTELMDATSPISEEITNILRFSYDRLKDKKLKECILHCALYSEDYLIDRNMLIDQLIALGTVEKGRTSKQKVNKCHGMLNELVRNCLLIDTCDKNLERCVKLHDSVRDMVIRIMRETPSRFLLESNGEIWNEGLEKVSLTGNSNISTAEPPNCPRLSTLVLPNAKDVGFVPEDFFTRMKGLCILDLSNTSIQTLPGSISGMENLAVLLLRNCKNLECMPDLSEVRMLIRLDLYNSGIKEFPQGLEKLTKMMHLDLGGINPRHYPKGLLRDLSELCYLSITLPREAELESAKELMALEKLETLKVVFGKFTLFSAYLRSTVMTRACDFRFRVGSGGFMGIIEPGQANEAFSGGLTYSLRRVFEWDHSVSLCFPPKALKWYLPMEIPSNVENLIVEVCPDVAKSLNCLTSVDNISNLKRLLISRSSMDYVLHYSPAVFPLLRNIKELELDHLPNLHALVGPPEGHGTASSSPPLLPFGSFSALKELTLRRCGKLKTLFVFDKDASLPDLEKLIIKECEQLEEIIAYENKVTAIMNLPSLKSIIFSDLPVLKSAQFVADSLSHATISDCPELKEVAFSLPPSSDTSETRRMSPKRKFTLPLEPLTFQRYAYRTDGTY